MDNGASSYRRFLDGDEGAFDEIMDALFYSLVFFVERYVHDFHAAEDIAMDAFSDLIVHRHRYNFKVTLKTYLFMIGRSRALNYLKHRKIISFTELSDAHGMADDEKTPEEHVLSDERRRAVNAVVSKLPADMSTVIHLVCFEEMTYDEAAKVMKKSRKQVDNLLYRAKKELRYFSGKTVKCCYERIKRIQSGDIPPQRKQDKGAQKEPEPRFGALHTALPDTGPDTGGRFA